MAVRSFDVWRSNVNENNIWAKDTLTVTTTGAYLISCQINDPSYQEAVVDGDSIKSNALIILASPDLLQPATSPFVSMAAVTTDSAGDQSYLNPWNDPTFSDTGYGYWSGTLYFSGAVTSGVYNADYSFDSLADFQHALENGQITPISETCYFDVYINGSDKPNIWANWTVGESISPVNLLPRVWIGVQDLTALVSEFTTDEATGLKIPNTGAWYVNSAGSYSYGGSYQSTFLTIQQYFEKYLNAISKLEHWGFDGDPAFVTLYLQMLQQGAEGLSGIGDLFYVRIYKNGTAEAHSVDGSSDSPGFFSVLRLHYGEPDYVPPADSDDYGNGVNIDNDDFGKYDPSHIPNPEDFTDPVGFDGNGVLTTTYAVSAATLRNIGQKLWSQDYFNVLKIQTNPMENIVSVKHYPFAQTGVSQEVKIGDVAFGINGDKVPSVKAMSIGSYIYSGYFKNFLDLAPFTTIKIYLPYCGLFQLDPADILNCKLSVKYYVDLVTGQCMAKLLLDERQNGKAIPFMSVYGNMGVDIPLSATDRVQTEIRATGAAISAMGSVAGHLMGGDALGAAVNGAAGALNIAGADYNTQRTASQSPTCCTFDTQDIFIMIERPASEYIERNAPTGYKHLHGLPSNKYRPLSDYPAGSFVQVDARTDLVFDTMGATGDENRMLEEQLKAGVYI